MLEEKTKRKSTIKIVPAINIVLLSECCHSYVCEYIIAPFEEKSNNYFTKSIIFVAKNLKKNLKISHSVDGKVQSYA